MARCLSVVRKVFFIFLMCLSVVGTSFLAFGQPISQPLMLLNSPVVMLHGLAQFDGIMKPHMDRVIQAVKSPVISAGNFFISGQSSQTQSRPSLVDLVASMLQDTAKSLNDSMGSQEEFLDKVISFKQHADASLPAILERMSNIIMNYADKQTVLESSEQLLIDMQQLANDLNSIPVDFPQLEEVSLIVRPYLDRFIDEIEAQAPALTGNDTNPFMNSFMFFQSAEQSNFLGLGSFFRIEPIPDNSKSVLTESKEELSIVAGVETRKIIFQEVKALENDDLVYYKVIRDNQLVVETSKPLDVTILHSLPSQMRKDGVNEIFVRFVQEYINIVNYHLAKNHNEKDLVIPDGDPEQLVLPPGYSPEVFRQNFLSILMSIPTT